MNVTSGKNPRRSETNDLTCRAATLAAAVAVLLSAAPAAAQLPMPATTQFDITGFIQEAVLDPACASDAHCGGTIKVNGHVVVIPKETIVILPASALTWQELFALAPAPYTGVATGMALADVPAPLTSYEAHVVGNRVLGGPAGADLYIAGLVNIAQQGLNSGAGFINFIDYAIGEMRVGGVLGDSTTGARVRINDPAVGSTGTGRYGRAMTPDVRFQVDQDNPTIASATGFPMCLPRVAPAGVIGAPETDPLCPQANRPAGASIIQMNDPVALAGVFPDATKQVPFEVGDYVTFAGTLVTDSATPTTGPFPPAPLGAAGTYVSAHTIIDNIAVYTWPGTNPAYVSIEVSLIGTGGLTVLGAGEAVIRTRFEGMTTDPSRNVHLYGIDFDPLTGATTDRDFGTIGVDPGAPTGAVKGRWRFRPPCTATVADQKSCTPPPGGTFLPPPREVRAVVEGAWVPGQATTFANGIIAGQYHAPIGEYIFPENIPGTPIVANNFNTIPFLAQGGYASLQGTIARQLNPWPDAVIPTPACLAPSVNTGGPYTVAAGGTVTLAGSATGTAPVTFAWVASSGTLSNATIAAPVFNATGATSPVALTLTATNACGTASASTTVTINAAAAPTVNHVPPLSVFSGAAASFTVSGTDPNVPAQTLAFTVVQAGAPALGNLKVTALTATSATVSFTAPVLPLGQVVPSVVNLTITARNTGGATSAAEFTTVTVNPLPDSVALTSSEYRIGKQRLVLTATSSVVSPDVILTLQPYVTVGGTTFDPTALGSVFTNTGAGTYTLTLVGAPEPAVPPATPLVVKSNLGGTSPPTALQRIRQ
jgi:hypothetical protein